MHKPFYTWQNFNKCTKAHKTLNGSFKHITLFYLFTNLAPRSCKYFDLDFLSFFYYVRWLFNMRMG
ncbi:hypothetical protein CGLO_11710 [Colletotrichum gloeosporioides Cg-14]|uniref:Uncharacterized protein n=1 Tax=Colletotrichum gloeosporioides (strain Cg-14) TaxID=1237896 RepID=T0LL58_COLGC|nr:hypothetical protein CGLO_11710 [Colletotrichum gloeosporioides Cg-14]